MVQKHHMQQQHPALYLTPQIVNYIHGLIGCIHNHQKGMLPLSIEQALQAQSASGLATTLDEADIWTLLASQDICTSEEQLLHIVTQWCKAHASDQFLQMMMHIDFGRLKHAQVFHYPSFLETFCVEAIPVNTGLRQPVPWTPSY